MTVIKALFGTLAWAALALAAMQAALTHPVQAAPSLGKRVALVIGNSKYPTAPLKNPANDARAMARTLKELGFEVTLRENTGQRELAAAVRQFGSTITPGSAAVFYYAGHGMQVKGRNYLVPVDADIQVEDEVPYSTIDVNQVLDKMEVGKSAVNIVILDACRNNPFARRFRSSGTGLAQMDAPIGTLIAFATAPGSVAQDGTGENGVYTKHLLESIAMPGLAVEQMFKRVRVGVAKDTHEAQVPWESSSMKGDFVFREAAPQQTASQDKMIEEAVRAAAERAATLTAERMTREQAARQPQDDRARTEQAALAAERERLLRERDRLAAENEALRRKPAPVAETVALAAPTAAATRPASASRPTGGNLPEVGNVWTYRYSDGYGKSSSFEVRLTSVSDDGIQDERRIGKHRESNSFSAALGVIERKLGDQVLREVSPYLLTHGPDESSIAKTKVEVFAESELFTARFEGTESVTVPAGRFVAKKLVIQGMQTPPNRGGFMILPKRSYTITAWYAPSAKRYVKVSFFAPSVGSGNALAGAERDMIELERTNFPMSFAQDTPAKLEPDVKVASLSPALKAVPLGPPKPGDAWTYRYTDVYGKSEKYTIKVKAVSGEEIVDEASLGKSRHSSTFSSGLEFTDRKLGSLSFREVSPYLISHGPPRESPEWKSMSILEGSPPFSAKLAASETVQVPAGTFEAYKLVIEGHQYKQRNNPAWGSNPYTITIWYSPAAKRLVKLNINGPSDKETIELVDFSLQ